MAQKGTVYEYVDDQGVTHKVDSIQQVPKKYYRTMLAIGPELEEETQESSGFGFGPIGSFDLGAVTEQTGVGLPLLLGAVVTAVVCVRAKDFFIKVVSGVISAGLIFFVLYSWGESSGLLKTAEKKRPVVEEQAAEE